MKKVMIALVLLLPSAMLFAQKKNAEVRIPMTPDRWETKAGSVSFTGYKSRPAIRLLTQNDAAVVKGLDFSSGTIEFDWAPEGPYFAGFYFRRKDTLETECFYLRTHVEGIPNAMQAVQYAPFLDGVNLWDLLPNYQGPADVKKNEWNHFKLVISGQRMVVYVNDMQRPALHVPQLLGNTRSGAIAFDGAGKIANLVIRPDQVEGLSPEPESDPTYNDPRYLRNWQISSVKDLPWGQEPFNYKAPQLNENWKSINAERLGMINITRTYGKTKDRRMVWLKIKLKAAKAQIRRVDLAFNDEVWIYLNNLSLFTDKNIFATPLSKQPLGRMSLENTHFDLPLKEGENEILVAISNHFYGWGLIARLDDMEGIEVIQ
ncbi:hypothetical protein ACFOTA_05880 [Chitinophaga sp. GCM10012297]|uniref:DUF1080 domain-containing protein n=1 Tax=Chitinophaga chungangae TaxID=2821488 RepID=A0ABS3YAM3_9BACT|nr:hypothetical protein [Chitinophaga chungangae]MBO9151727.1 hypothetical protein [Chitinophaga chungangae]